jgi:thioredoxin-related protein
MRTIFFLILLLGIFIMPATARESNDTAQHSQATDTLKPYQKYPKLPAFNIRMMDSVTVFNTYNIPEGRKTMIVFFSPDCKHCQSLVKHLLKGMDSLENVQFYMITPVHSMTDLRNFYEKYHLAEYKNIKLVGRDYEFFFGTFYGIKVVPDLALYDEHKMLIKLFEGNVPIAELYKYTR